MIIKAIFKGSDGSCGYRKNTEYTLEVYHNKKQYITINNFNNGGGYCDYESMIAFLNNWENIRKV